MPFFPSVRPSCLPSCLPGVFCQVLRPFFSPKLRDAKRRGHLLQVVFTLEHKAPVDCCRFVGDYGSDKVRFVSSTQAKGAVGRGRTGEGGGSWG